MFTKGKQERRAGWAQVHAVSGCDKTGARVRLGTVLRHPAHVPVARPGTASAFTTVAVCVRVCACVGVAGELALRAQVLPARVLSPRDPRCRR